MASDRDTLIVLSALARSAAMVGDADSPDYGLLRLAVGIENFLDSTEPNNNKLER